MKNHCHLWFAALLCSSGFTGATHSEGDLEDLDQAARDQRQTTGFLEVAHADALVKEFQSGRIDEAAFTAEIWEQYPLLTASLYAEWGTINSCFLRDLVLGQANGVLTIEASGKAIFFDTTRYLDSQGHVIGGREREFNTATRANRILGVLRSEWIADPACNSVAFVSNYCCKCAADCNCSTPMTGARCDTTYGNQNCATGSTICPP